jgi:hypothetical protein
VRACKALVEMAFRTLPLVFLGLALISAGAFVHLASLARKKGQAPGRNLIIASGLIFLTFFLLWLFSR